MRRSTSRGAEKLSFLRWFRSSGVEMITSPRDFESSIQEAVEQAIQLSPDAQVEFVLNTAVTLGNRLVRSDDLVAKPVSALLRKKLPFTPAQILQLVQAGALPKYYFHFTSV